MQGFLSRLIARALGNSESSSYKTPPKSIIQINSSLYELYSPTSEAPEIEIVFFHGLQLGDYKDAYWTAWSNDDASVIWPVTLLSKDYPRARIMSVSYNILARQTSFDLYIFVENLLADLVFDNDAAVGAYRPLILVGHSLGGLVIKNLLLYAEERKSRLLLREEQSVEFKRVARFLDNVRGLVFYSTPHGGSQLGYYIAKLRGTSDTLQLFKVLSKETGRLNDNFRHWRQLHSKPSLSFYELQPTHQQDLSGVIVSEASAKVDSDSYYPVHANHINICKPTKKSDSVYLRLANFIQMYGKGLTIGSK